jgi:hypothetical protein
VRALAGEDHLLVDNRQRVVEARQLEPTEEPVHHVRRLAPVAGRLRDRRRARHRVARSKDPAKPGLQGDGVRLEPSCALSGETREGREVGAHADRDDGPVAGELVPHGVVVGGGEPPGLVEHGGAALELDRAQRLLAGEADDPPSVVELHPFIEGLVDLPGVRRHLGTPLQADDVDRRGAQAPGAPGGVDGDVAAAHHDHRPAAELRRLVELDVAEEVERAHHLVELVLSPDVQLCGAGGPGRHEDRVEPLPPQPLEVVDPGARHDLDPEVGQVGEVGLYRLGRQAVGGDGEPHRAARRGSGLEDLHRVALAGELPRRSDSRGARSDHRDPTAVRRRPFDPRRASQGVVPVGHEPLDPSECHRALEHASSALGLAGRVAGSAQRRRERGRLEHEAKGLFVLAAAHQGDVAVSLDPRWAGEGAGGGAGALDERLLRHRLGEGDVRGSP